MRQVLGEDFPQDGDEDLTLFVGADRYTKILLDPRLPKVAHDDAAAAQRLCQFRRVMPWMTDKDEIGLRG